MARTYESEKQNAAALPKFYLGQEVVVPGGEKGVIQSLEFPTNGLYMSPELAKAVVWFGAKSSAKIEGFGGRWSAFSFSLSDLKPIEF